jgi:hypothetical protein
MMSPDRSQGSLDPAIVADLKLVMTRSLESGDHSDDLKAVLARATSDARAKGLQAEQLLIALKELWFSLPQLAASPGSETQTRLLQQLVARCIQEYYSA